MPLRGNLENLPPPLSSPAQCIALIPVYKPEKTLIELAIKLIDTNQFMAVVVVDDGSGAEYCEIFTGLEEHGIKVLRHAVNLGKGAALKTGINYIACTFPNAIGCVTLDADGQHLVEDCIQIAQSLESNPNSLTIGCRRFDKELIPLRSRFGNAVTRQVFRFFTGMPLSDTQSGLRGIPASLFPSLLRLKTNGYDFEQDMLMSAHSSSISITEIPIQTVYLNNNEGSHFSPFWDSLKIYMVFLRFNFSSLLSVLISYTIFSIAILLGSSILWAIVLARLISGSFNYILNHNLVFKSSRKHHEAFPRYALCVFIFGGIVYGLTTVQVEYLGVNVFLAMMLSEALLYVISFTVQRDLVFTHKQEKGHLKKRQGTDRESIYSSKNMFSSITAFIGFRGFKKDISTFVPNLSSFVELGGANSIFYSHYKKYYPNAELYLVDQCVTTEKFLKTTKNDTRLHIIKSDLLDDDLANLQNSADCVASFGLIEHFDPENTAKIIDQHFAVAKSDGIVYLSFPTPTPLYKAIRGVLEFLGKWPFHDERPLEFKEVLTTVEKHGTVLKKSLCLRLGLTQGVLVVRKRG